MMKKSIFKGLLTLLIAFVGLFQTQAQELPNPCVVGYWENWYSANFIRLEDVDDRYNVICIAFSEGTGGTDYSLTLVPPLGYNQWTLQSEIAQLQAEGRKVLLSIGGANDPVMLDSDFEKSTFVSSVGTILTTYGFDGIDIDLEGESLHFNNITIENPTDARLTRMIEGIQEILTNYQTSQGKRCLLTMAPETIYVQGGLSSWAVNNAYGGAYLPMIEALASDIDMINVQLYNTGDMFGLDGRAYEQSTADFIVSQTEAVILGFDGIGSLGTYSGLPASKVGVGLPGCQGWGYTDPLEVEAAIKYLQGVGPKPGNYTLRTADGYPDLRGMMTWSINSDKACNPSYDFVRNYEFLFTDAPHFIMYNQDPILEGEEDGGVIVVDLSNDTFVPTINAANWVVYNLPSGVSLGSVTRINDTIAHINLSGNSTYGSYLGDIENVNVYITPAELVLEDMNLNRNTGVVLTQTIVEAPGRVEAEDFIDSTAVEISVSGDAGGGYRVMFREDNDALEHKVLVTTTSEYEVTIRFSNRYGDGKFNLLIDGSPILSNITVPVSNSWNSWTTGRYYFGLDAGVHTMELVAEAGGFDVNWIEFAVTTGYWDGTNLVPVDIYPNPAGDLITINGDYEGSMTIFDNSGKAVLTEANISDGSQIDVSELTEGIYNIQIRYANGSVGYQKLIKE